MHIVETMNLTKKFQRLAGPGPSGQKRGGFAAVSDVNMRIAQGAFVTITGKSGSGKTTLLTLLAGLATPSSGSVLWHGKNIHALPDKSLSALRNREMSFIPQGMGLLGNLTVADNVRVPQLFDRGNGAGSDRVDFLLEAVGLQDLALEYPCTLSGGEMRRVSIARALFNEPSLLVADEPTSDLDPDNTRLVMDLLRQANKQGTTVLVVTHGKEVASYGDVRFSMSDGLLSRME